MKDISKYAFYKTINVSNGFLDKAGTIGADKCQVIIENYKDINLHWLITGEGEMINIDNHSSSLENKLLLELNDCRKTIDQLRIENHALKENISDLQGNVESNIDTPVPKKTVRNAG